MTTTTTTYLNFVYGNLGTNERWSNADYGANWEKADAAFAPISAMTAFGQSLVEAAAAANARTLLGISAFGATLIDDTTAGAALTTLGVSAFAQTLLDDAAASNARTTLGAGTTGAELFTAATLAAARTTLAIGYSTSTASDANYLTATGAAAVDGALYVKYTV